MAEYIDREKIAAEARELSTHVLNEWDTLGVLALIDRQPAADVAPVVHARWRKEYTLGWYDGEQNYKLICPSCNYSYLDNHLGAIVPKHFNYCPNCGAKMDESEDDNG